MVKHICFLLPTTSGKSIKVLARRDLLVLLTENTSVQVFSNSPVKTVLNLLPVDFKDTFDRRDHSKSPVTGWNLTPFLLSHLL